MQIAVVVMIAVLAIGVVLFPLLRRPSQVAGAPISDAALDHQVKRYRNALKEGTLCERCLTANPSGSKFCADCGRPL